AVEIAERRLERVDALLETAVETLERLLAQVADEVCRDDCLDIGSQPATSGVKVERLIDEMDGDAGVDKLAEVGPIPQVPRAPVDLVDDESVGLALPQEAEHLRELRATALRRRPGLLEPLGNGEAVGRGIAGDRIALFLRRYPFYLLLGR